MKVIVDIEDSKQEVEIVRDGSNLSARVGDRKYAIEVSEPEKNVFLLKNSGKIFEALVSPAPATSTMRVRIGTSEFEAAIIDPKRLRGSKSSDDDESGRAEVKTAMPGKVVRILVAVGDTVQKGDGVIVVEAMKMQNEMKSPKDGVVNEIRVAESETVGAGDVLVIID